MKKENYIYLLLGLLICLSCQTPTSTKQDKEAILKVMNAQEKAWSNNDLEGFMQGYWQSDSLTFYGRNGITKGWQQTLTNYKSAYGGYTCQ